MDGAINPFNNWGHAGLYFLKKKKKKNPGIGNLRDKLKNSIGRAPVFLASHDSVHDSFPPKAEAL